MKFVIALFLLSIVPSFAVGAECNSINANISDKAPTIARKVQLSGSIMTLSGTMGGKALPKRRLPCVPLFQGVLCEVHFAQGVVTVMTNRNMMVETVTDAAGRESGVSYACNQAFKMQR